MKPSFKMRHFEKIVSIFIFLAIFFLVTMGVFLAKQKKLFSGKVYFYTIIESAEKINPGQEITLKGPNIAIGKIEGFSIAKENKVRVDFFVYEEYSEQIKTDSIIIFTAPLFGVLGGYKVEITPGGEYYYPLSSGSLIPSNHMQEGIFLLSLRKGVDKEQQQIPLINKIDPLLENITVLLDPKGQLMKNITAMLYNLNVLTMQMNQGGVFSILGSPALKMNLERITEQIYILLQSGDALVNKEVKNIMAQVYLLLLDVKKLSETVNYNTPKMMGQINSILFRVERMLENIEKNPLLSGGGYKSKGQSSTKNYFEGQ